MFDVLFHSTMFLAILPELLLLILAGVILAIELLVPEENRNHLGWIAAAGIFFIMVISLLVARPGNQPVFVWGGMLRFDWLGFVFKLLFLFGAAITSLFVLDIDKLCRRGEFYLLLLASTLGMCMMASSADLIMLYLSIETTSIPLYVLAGFLTRDDKSTEAGFKYLLFGAMTSTIMLYGFSLLYGFSGTTDIYTLAQVITGSGTPDLALLASLLLVIIGFSFKISAVPLHFWAPDVYEGAPTPVAGFLSTASKAAGFAVLLRFLLIVFPAPVDTNWAAILTAISVATMTLGNLLALAQKNIKRMLAYSSIAHAGYALIGVVTLNPLGYSATVFYLVAYLITNLAAFGVVTAVGRVTGSDEMSSYHGLSRRSPGLALAFMVALLSLAGMPPLGGFITKFFIFAAAVKANLIWLAVVGVLNSIVGLYYYLTVLKYVYLFRADGDEIPLAVPGGYKLALIVLVFGIILIGTIFAPWFNWADTAAAALF